MTNIKLYNTLTKKKENFTPIIEGEVKMYHCGPTVYDFVHIGNLFAFTFDDLLRRMFEYQGYKVTQVMNVTDVGHLTSDDDAGEDKMAKGARRTGKTVWEVAQFYTDAFLEDSAKMNLLPPHIRPYATKHVQEMIDLITVLVDKGMAYVTPTAVYFDVSKFPEYTKLSGQKLDENIQKAREEIVEDVTKKNWYDFRLWQLDQPDHAMQWESPWGKGFPGWHIECSAMSMKYLGETFDIHTGGVDHIPVHHTNEIAQSEGATGKQFSKYWMHNQFILVDNEKMSKSKGNFYNLRDLEMKGFEPLALRLLFLQSKYREQLNFTLEALEAAQIALSNIRKQIRDIVTKLHNEGIEHTAIKAEKKENAYQSEFENGISDDLNTSVALSAFFRLLKDQNIDQQNKLEQIYSFDQVLGLKLEEIGPFVESDELKELKQKWQEARERKDWAVADTLRAEIQKMENAA
jgi:cysteinyl-tRNA synthetase